MQRLVQVRSVNSKATISTVPAGDVAKKTSSGNAKSTRGAHAKHFDSAAVRSSNAFSLQLVGYLIEWLVQLQFGSDAGRSDRRDTRAHILERCLKVSCQLLVTFPFTLHLLMLISILIMYVLIVSGLFYKYCIYCTILVIHVLHLNRNNDCKLELSPSWNMT